MKNTKTHPHRIAVLGTARNDHVLKTLDDLREVEGDIFAVVKTDKLTYFDGHHYDVRYFDGNISWHNISLLRTLRDIDPDQIIVTVGEQYFHGNIFTTLNLWMRFSLLRRIDIRLNLHESPANSDLMRMNNDSRLVEQLIHKVRHLSNYNSSQSEPARGATHPGIIFVSLPKSGSTYILRTLSKGLSLEEYSISFNYFPFDMVSYEKLKDFDSGGKIVRTHLCGSKMNMHLLSQFVDRLAIHLRDPRQATLSWTHFLNKLKIAIVTDAHYANTLNFIYPKLPDNYFSFNLNDQISYQIENHLPLSVKWIEEWVENKEKYSNKIKIIFTTFESMIKDEMSFIHKLLDFYGVPKDKFIYQLIEKDDSCHYRKGEIDEWRSVFSAQQLKLAQSVVPDKLLETFGWER